MEKRINILVGKFLSGNLTPAEEMELAHLIESNEEAANLFYEYCQIWSGGEKVFNIPDPERSLQNIIERTKRNERATKKLFRVKITTLLKVAAVILVLVMGGTYWLNNPGGLTGNRIEIVTTSAETKDVKLPDGSTIYLNEHSRLSYAKSFAERVVKFTGEGLFEITQDSLSPFVVEVSDVEIQVLGTTFNVRAHKNEQNIEVSVMEGKVRVNNRGENQQILLIDSETGLYNRNSRNLDKVDHNLNAASWKTGYLDFNDWTMEQVAITLSRHFKKRMIFKNQVIKDCLFTGEFKQESKTEILETLTFATGLEFTENDSTIIVYGQSCK